jgi:hypothetical protein
MMEGRIRPGNDQSRQWLVIIDGSGLWVRRRGKLGGSELVGWSRWSELLFIGS